MSQACWEYALQNQDKFRSKEFLLRKGKGGEDPDEITRDARLENLRTKKEMMLMGNRDVLSDLMKRGVIRRTDEKTLLAYEKKLKKECPELGLDKVYTDGKPDPFLIRRHLKNHETTAEERRLFEKYCTEPAYQHREFEEWRKREAEEKKKEAEKKK